MIFQKLSELNIRTSLVTIRVYEAGDFTDLNSFFDSEQLKWFPDTYVNFESYLSEKLASQEKKDLVLLSLIDNRNKKVFGVTTLFDISDRHNSLEVGSTWIAKEHQGTGYNLLFKFYLFKFLIENVNLNRVQLKTDSKNLKSVNAMKSVGLNYEGKLLSHMIVREGAGLRDSEFFSVTKNTWKGIELFMTTKLNKKFNNIKW